MSTDGRIQLRVEQAYLDMLDALEELEKKASIDENRAPLTRQMIVKDALRFYYAAKTNEGVQNAYSDYTAAILQQNLDSAVLTTEALIHKEINRLEKTIVKTYLLARLNLVGTDADEDEELTRRAIRASTEFDRPIAELADEILKRNRSKG